MLFSLAPVLFRLSLALAPILFHLSLSLALSLALALAPILFRLALLPFLAAVVAALLDRGIGFSFFPFDPSYPEPLWLFHVPRDALLRKGVFLRTWTPISSHDTMYRRSPK